MTEYFLAQVNYNQGQHGLDTVVKQRDEFIKSNKIARIDDEDITVTGVGGNLSIFVLKLTYYPKK